MPVKARSSRHTLRDLLLYIGIGIVTVGFVAYWGVRQALSGDSSQFPVRWIFLVAETALIFGYVLRVFWGSRRRRKFWLVFLSVLGVHIAVAVPVLAKLHSTPPLLILSLCCPVEYFFISYVLLTILRTHENQ